MVKSVARGRWGHLLADDKIEDCGKARIARDFLQQVMARMAKRSFDFWNRYDREDYPLRYNERQLLSLISAAVDQITPCHLTEMPVSRMPKKELAMNAERKKVNGQAGRADLWCYYRNTDIILEIKRIRISPEYAGERSRPNKAWIELCDQISGLKDDLDQWSSNYLRVGLMLVLAVETKRESKYFSEKEPSGILENVCQALGTAYDMPWCAAWVPPNGPVTLEQDWEDSSSRIERVPTVLFFAHMVRKGNAYA